MRSLEINKREIYYAQRIGSIESGAYGEITPVYSEPKAIRIRVVYVDSSIYIAEYHKNSECDVKLITENTSYPFDENTVFWIDASVSFPHDYIMSQMPNKSLNGTVYYLKKVEVSDA